PIFVLAPKTAGVQLAAADTTTKKTLMTAGANGARVRSVNVVTDDTAPNDVGLYLQIGGAGTVYPLASKRVPARSGDPTVANPTAVAVNLLDLGAMPALEADGSLTLGAGDVLQVAVQATVTAAKTV